MAVSRKILTSENPPEPQNRWDRNGAYDFLAIAAGELPSHRLDHLPLSGRGFQRPRHILAELAQPKAAAAHARRRRINHHALAGKMVGEGVAFGPLARKASDRRRFRDRLFRRQFVFRRAGFQLFEGERQLIDQPHRSFRLLPVDLTLQLGDPQFLLRDQRHVFRRLRAGDRQFRGDFQAVRLCNGQRRFQGGVFSGKSGARGVHKTK